MEKLDDFEEIWCVDFEFSQPEGERPIPRCLCASEFKTGKSVQVWQDEFNSKPPYRTDKNVLFVAFYASAEVSCHLALGWAMPRNILDLYVEFKRLTSNKTIPCGKGLLGALTYFGLDTISAPEKESMRQLALSDREFTKTEKLALLDYCKTDVDALAKLLPRMNPIIDLPRALLRGEFMKTVAVMEWNGIPLDSETWHKLESRKETLKGRLIRHIDKSFRVYEDGSFSAKKFQMWTRANGISWPTLESGKLALDDDTFREQASLFPEVEPLRQLRSTLSTLNSNKLIPGSDGRNRCLLSPFASKTSRNQPSNSKFIFGFPSWYRRFIKPAQGRSLAYIDYSQQEVAIAASLSGDEKMQQAYLSGDVYLTFGKQAGVIPQRATKETHKQQRDVFKQIILATQYGMREESLSRKLDVSVTEAKNLLGLHKSTYRTFWDWQEKILNKATLTGNLETVLGWKLNVVQGTSCRTVANFLIQATGAEILRVACIALVQQGIQLCAPIHDAVLVEAATTEIQGVVSTAQKLMCEASKVVLGGFEIRTDAKIIHHPDRFQEEKGTQMWETVSRLLAEIDGGYSSG